MSRAVRSSALALIVAFAAGCASMPSARTPGGAAADDVRDQLFKLQKDSARVLAKLDALESAAGDDGALATCATVAAKMDEVERRLIVLEEQSIAAQQRLEQTLGELRAMRRAGWAGPGGEAGGNSGTSAGEWVLPEENASGSSAPRIDAGSLPPEDLFNAAYADYSRGKNELALAGFEAAYNANPTGPLADDARYWSGETLLAMGRHAEAARAFDRVITEFEGGSYVRQSHFKKGIALIEARRTTEGVEELQYVIETWPDSDEARTAREYARQKGILQE